MLPGGASMAKTSSSPHLSHTPTLTRTSRSDARSSRRPHRAQDRPSDHAVARKAGRAVYGAGERIDRYPAPDRNRQLAPGGWLYRPAGAVDCICRAESRRRERVPDASNCAHNCGLSVIPNACRSRHLGMTVIPSGQAAPGSSRYSHHGPNRCRTQSSFGPTVLIVAPGS